MVLGSGKRAGHGRALFVAEELRLKNVVPWLKRCVARDLQMSGQGRIWGNCFVETETMASDERAADRSDGSGGLRHARMKRQTAVLMSRRGDVWTTELDDISATGALLARPDNWEGEAGELWVLDMLFHDNLNIHLEARIARVSRDRIGFEFARIPEDKQAPLWNLLGGYADTLEPWNDLEE